LDGWKLFRCFNGVLNFFLGDVYLGLDRTHFGVDVASDVGYGLPECSYNLAQALTKTL
jgi:hypothetical protein